ncbi:MAG: ABC transporter substrate-binding protein, partial [Rhodobacteraceae bacterium]|nr:ABC transporter substrate-binding protein [Paracoccaceae bacterium]
DAGYSVGDNGIRTAPDGTPFELTFLLSATSPATLRGIMENYVANVENLGIDITLEVVDAAQYTSRERDRDYDMVVDSYAALLGVGTGLQQRFGSEAAAFSLFNPAGLASPLVDAIIEKALVAESREEENASLSALDRALRYEFIMIPTWYKANHWVAYYDMYEHPESVAPFNLGYMDYWWYNADGAAALKASGALR